MLCVLARLRLLAATEQPELPSAEHGWVELPELCRLAAVANEYRLNQYVFHARAQFGRAGVDNPAALIDRGRPGKLRLGTDRVIIEHL
jgi:hypothetical protein